MTNETHRANRRHWDGGLAAEFQKQSEETQMWRRCLREPEEAFDGGALQLIRECVPDVAGKEVCLVGSGDNHAAFALAGMGARLTSVDQSERQLETAAERAAELELEIAFVRADAADMGALENDRFDLVCSTNGFFVWLADLHGVFSEIRRLLKPGGAYVFYDIHPFQRPWKEVVEAAEMEKPYFETGPFSDSGEGPFYFHWKAEDLLNALADAGLVLRRLRESPARESRMWEGSRWYLRGEHPERLDWRNNPRAGLPVWLAAALQKPAGAADQAW